MKERARGIAGDVNVGEPVVVEVGSGGAHAEEAGPVESGAGGDVGEASVPEIAIESVAHRCAGLSTRGLAAVDEEKIEFAVVVEVEERDAAGGGLQQEAVRRLPVEVTPCNAGGRGNVAK